MSDSADAAKAQIVEKLKTASNILVTVSSNPSVDALAACIATTMLLTKYKKNATAVFSGKIPKLLDFLKPGENIEKNTDSLRDFIIALDKSKADKLRYKIEDDVVKIFITPYRTSITDKDLKYSAGEFNVDLILALGVQHQQDLDTAITSHGRIFHDAVTMTINNEPGGDLGTANWEDLEASSLSELIADLASQLDGTLLDADISTALLTGIVAETSRFSNDKTHPRTLNISSVLLQAGADQQLVNNQLQDLIGTVVTLEAGTEIKPTEDLSNEPLHHEDGAGELVIDETGSIKQVNPDEKSDAAPGAGAAAASEPAAQPEPKPEPAPETRTGTQPEAPAPSVDAPLIPDLELPDLAAPAAQPEEAKPADSNDDADAARQAVESALGAGGTANQPASAPDFSPPAFDTSTPAATPAMPAIQPAPMIQPIAPNQPSYTNPATTTQYDAPPAPVNEPAPLGMSPADQAFTMPLPPSSSMPNPQTSLQSGPPANQQPPTGPTAPPLPPPVTPPQFG